MKLVFCWPTISGYMAACWRELAQRAGVDVFVLAFPTSRGKYSSFDPELLAGVPSRMLDEAERGDLGLLREIVASERPDVLFFSGWQHRPYLRIARDGALPVKRRIMMIDKAHRPGVRQLADRAVLPRLLRLVDAVFVPGERSWQYARAIGFDASRIFRGTYGVDWRGAGAALELRSGGGAWPRSFLFAGQFIGRKGIDVLVDAYRRYRTRVPDPWPLQLCGRGPAAPEKGEPGIVNRGFLQPAELRAIYSRSGVFVLPSRSDAWPLAIVEAAAAGLPIVCTEACGSAVEVVRPFHNGLVVPTEDAAALARALEWMHAHADRLPEMGRASRELAAPYSAQRWADRIVWSAERVLMGAEA